MELFFSNGGALFLIGIFLGTALFFITIYFGLEKKKSYLFFFSYALFGGMSLLFIEKGMSAGFLISSTFASLSLLYFFASFFEIEKLVGVGVFGIILVLIAGYNYQFITDTPKPIFYVIEWFIYILVLMACTWISLQAIKRNQFAGKLLFITTTVIFVLIVLLISNSFFVSSLTISSVVLILSVTYTVFHDFKERQSLLKSLRMKAVQLENEMLKKSIQPHFLMNTLTALSEWIESQPELAVKQIELLSEEFRYITRVSGETLVGIKDEIKMCRVHLDIFNARQHAEFKLETEAILPNTKIPPMIFHTLIENGLTYSDKEKGRFVIEQEETEKSTIFRITSEPLIKQNYDGEGLGISYIKSRLEGAFPGRWVFTSKPEADAWVTLIEITK
ncbi:MAG: histidine kinase [Ignavibacteriaceae bacterium]